MKQALDFYNQGQYVESYAVFERITKIQPGDPRVQKYMSQLKNEIAAGYYTAGTRSYSANKFDQAVSYFNNAKKWGADTSAMDGLIKQARDAKEDFLRFQQEQRIRAQQMQEEIQEAAENVETIETVTVDNPIPVQPVGPIPGVTPGTGNETLPTIGGGATRVSAEASAASRAKYIEGLDAFNQDDYERARAAWIVAKQLDPGNSDADLGLRKVEELMK